MRAAILSYNNYNEMITSISLRTVRGRALDQVSLRVKRLLGLLSLVGRLQQIAVGNLLKWCEH